MICCHAVYLIRSSPASDVHWMWLPCVRASSLLLETIHCHCSSCAKVHCSHDRSVLVTTYTLLLSPLLNVYTLGLFFPEHLASFSWNGLSFLFMSLLWIRWSRTTTVFHQVSVTTLTINELQMCIQHACTPQKMVKTLLETLETEWRCHSSEMFPVDIRTATEPLA